MYGCVRKGNTYLRYGCMYQVWLCVIGMAVCMAGARTSGMDVCMRDTHTQPEIDISQTLLCVVVCIKDTNISDMAVCIRYGCV